MRMRTLRYSAVLLVVAAAVFLSGDRAFGIGFILGESKEELKLKYDVTVDVHSFGGTPTGRVTVVLTLADEGRLKPPDAVELAIPGRQIEQDGGRWMDLVVAIDMAKTDGGSKRAGGCTSGKNGPSGRRSGSTPTRWTATWTG